MNKSKYSLNIKKLMVTLVMILGVMILSACGANVDAEVEIKPDGSGTRTMEVSIPKTELQAYGNFDLSKVESVIADNCPDVLDYTYNEDKKNITATFTLQFSSLEDYMQKLNTFCDTNAKVEAYVGTSPFAAEMRYSENISTKDMLKWLVNALIDNKIVNDRYRSSIIGKVSTKLIYGSKVFSGGSGKLSISENIYCTIDSIDVYTSPAGVEKFTRVIRLNIRDEELEKNKENIDTYLRNAVPEGGFGEWDSAAKNGVQTYVVTVNSVTASELAEAMNTYTDTTDCDFQISDASSEDGLFYKGCAFRERVNWSNYACSSNGTVNVNYMIDLNSYEGSLIDERGGASRRISAAPSGDDIYVAFRLGEINESAIYADLAKYYHFSSVDYLLDVKNRNDITKEIALHFDNASAEEIGEISDKVKLLAKQETILENVGMDLSADTLVFTFKGSASEINEMMNAITGQENAAGISYACEKKWLVPLEKCIVTDVIDLEGIVYHDPNGDKYWDIPIQYEAKLSGTGKKLINEQPKIDKTFNGFEGKLSASRRSKAVYKVNHINGLAFVWYLLLLLGVVALASGIYFLIRSLVEKKKEAREEQHAREIGLGEAVEIEVKEEEPVVAGELEVKKEENPVTEEAATTEEVAPAEEVPESEETPTTEIVGSPVENVEPEMAPITEETPAPEEVTSVESKEKNEEVIEEATIAVSNEEDMAAASAEEDIITVSAEENIPTSNT